MKNSRGQQLLDTFRVLHGVPFMHTICFFKAWEVRSPTLQTVHELELKRRSYGHLKTTASSCGKISQLRNQLRNQPSLAKSTCAISDICHRLSENFSQDILCKFLFSPCNKLKILLGHFLENIFYIYL